MANKKLAALSGGLPSTIAAGDVGTIAGGLSITQDVSIGGNLVVTGNIISKGEVHLTVQDPMIDLGLGNSSTDPTAGGWSLSMNRNANFTASTATTFVAGVAGTSNPTVTVTNPGSADDLATGDIVCITGTTDSLNDGLYEVLSVDQATFPQVVTIAGIGVTAQNANLPFAKNQFLSLTGETASAYKVDLYVQVIANGKPGSFLDSNGTQFAKGKLLQKYAGSGEGAVLSDFNGNGDYSEVGVGSTKLQDAYENGNTIVLDGGNGPLAISGANAFTVSSTVNAILAIDLVTNGGTSETIRIKNTQGTGAGAVSIEATAALDGIGNAGATTQTGDLQVHANAGALSFLGIKSSYISLVIGTGTETLVLGAYSTAAAANAKVKMVGDFTSVVQRYYAIDALGPGHVVALVPNEAYASVTVTAIPAAAETLQFTTNSENWTITFVTGTSSVSWGGTTPNFTANVKRDGTSTTATIAADIAVLLNLVTDWSFSNTSGQTLVVGSAAGQYADEAYNVTWTDTTGTPGDVTTAKSDASNSISSNVMVAPAGQLTIRARTIGTGVYSALNDTGGAASPVSAGAAADIVISGYAVVKAVTAEVIAPGSRLFLGPTAGETTSTGPDNSGETSFIVGETIDSKNGATATIAMQVSRQFVNDIA